MKMRKDEESSPAGRDHTLAWGRNEFDAQASAGSFVNRVGAVCNVRIDAQSTARKNEG